jgi:conjugal transfer pilus assembly protein TraW
MIFGSAANASANIKHLGVFGKIYTIAETDALQEIESKAASIDWQKVIQSNENLEKLKNFKPKDISKLPKAIHDRTYLVDMTYTLDFDIPNGKGGILYPVGYTFNPLDYMDYPRTLVVFDAADPEQIEWLEASAFAKDINTRLLITDGIYLKTRTRLSRHVYFAMPTIINRLQLQAVPSVIRQKGNKMEVTEIDIAKAKE